MKIQSTLEETEFFSNSSQRNSVGRLYTLVHVSHCNTVFSEKHSSYLIQSKLPHVLSLLLTSFFPFAQKGREREFLLDEYQPLRNSESKFDLVVLFKNYFDHANETPRGEAATETWQKTYLERTIALSRGGVKNKTKKTEKKRMEQPKGSPKSSDMRDATNSISRCQNVRKLTERRRIECNADRFYHCFAPDCLAF